MSTEESTGMLYSSTSASSGATVDEGRPLHDSTQRGVGPQVTNVPVPLRSLEVVVPATVTFCLSPYVCSQVAAFSGDTTTSTSTDVTAPRAAKAPKFSMRTTNTEGHESPGAVNELIAISVESRLIVAPSRTRSAGHTSAHFPSSSAARPGGHSAQVA